jgi:hypothetical protein
LALSAAAIALPVRYATGHVVEQGDSESAVVEKAAKVSTEISVIPADPD